MTRTENRLVYTVEEVGQLLGISRGLAYEAVRRGEVPSLRVGKRLLVPRAALERLLTPGRQEAGSSGTGAAGGRRP